MKEIFVMEESCYNLRSKFLLHVPRASTPQNIVWKQYLSEVVKSGLLFLMTLKTRDASPASNVKLRHGMDEAVSATYVAD